eukprot:CAMPEP_0171363938 /NCGR_PEP_ID=MMETSP0879-20121228/3700_1 /TAXON_ID=67004 /ORGANISM="Thalassiosira weissflogii, Strain CCMP1336" /LENGTH=366 /DNA_ID=CAMNT_0011871201 /DNA_START=205 /DNA_END=1305 /DNA_ORIENTATION=+
MTTTEGEPRGKIRKANSSIESRIAQIQQNLMLTDEDLQDFYRSFCRMAKKDEFAFRIHRSPQPKQELKQGNASQTNGNSAQSKTTKITSDIENKEADQSSQRPWERDSNSTYPKVTLSLSECFAFFELRNGGFFDAIFELVGIKNFHAMIFGEFLDAVCTYSLFTSDDMIRFIFFTLDKNKQGRIYRSQLLHFIESLHGKKVLAFQQAIQPNEAGSDREISSRKRPLTTEEIRKLTIDYATLRKLCVHDYPTILEPAIRFQNTLRRRLIGEKWWQKKQIQLERKYEREQKMDDLREKARAKEEKRLLKERKDEIRSEIGWISYYFRRNERLATEKQYPIPKVKLEDKTGNILVDWTRTQKSDVDSG